MARKFPVTDSIRFLNFYGIRYFIPWEDLHPGGSFFIKTTAMANDVQKELDRVSKPMGMNLKAVQRVEFGYYGVRVWRID